MTGHSTLNLLVDVVTVLMSGWEVTTVQLVEINKLCHYFVVDGVSGLETKIKFGDLISH